MFGEHDLATDGAILAELRAHGRDGVTLAVLAERLGMTAEVVRDSVASFRRRGMVHVAGRARDGRGCWVSRWAVATPPDTGAPPGLFGQGAGSLAGDSGANQSTTPNAKRPVPDADDATVNRCSRPATSDAALERVGPHVATQRDVVLAVIADAGPEGVTDREIEAATGLRSTTPRRIELRDRGLVSFAGRYRKTPSGCDAMVWVLAEFAPKSEGGVA
jgi:hypothetical protein